MPQHPMDVANAGIAEPSKPHDLLGHFSTIVTTLTAVPGKPWLVTTDREGKVRVNRLAKDPLQVGLLCITDAFV